MLYVGDVYSNCTQRKNQRLCCLDVHVVNTITHTHIHTHTHIYIYISIYLFIYLKPIFYLHRICTLDPAVSLLWNLNKHVIFGTFVLFLILFRCASEVQKILKVLFLILLILFLNGVN